MPPQKMNTDLNDVPVLSKSVLRRQAVQRGEEMPTGFVTIEEHQSAIANATRELREKVEWLELLLSNEVSGVISIYPKLAHGEIVVNDDENNWHDESVTLKCQMLCGIPIETPELRKELEAALREEPPHAPTP